MLTLIRETSHSGARAPTILLAACALALASACADSDPLDELDSSASTGEREDASAARDSSRQQEPDAEEEEDEPGDALDASEPEQEDAAGSDAQNEADAESAGDDAALDGSASEGDAAVGDAAPDADIPDADVPDASAGDAQADAAVPDAGCPAAQPADACGVCGGDGSSCRHPLAGRYAARTQFYALQHANIGGTALDLISNGSVLSVVEVSPAGVATEHYCFLEIVSADGPLYVWSTPGTVQEIQDTSIALEERAGRVVRPLAAHHAYFGWSPEAPAGCVTGQTHTTGCLCGPPDALPSDEDDCRVSDIDDDGAPGASMYLDVAQATDPSATSTQLKINLVALLNLEWSLHPPDGNRIIGDISGGLEQAVLSLEGALSEDVEELDNRMCNSALGHVELVRDADATCASILLGRAADPVEYGIFDAAFDETTPSLEVCAPAP